MPRQYDRQALPLDRDPLKQLAVDIGKNPTGKAARDRADRTSAANANGLVATLSLFDRILHISDMYELLTGQEDGDTTDLGTRWLEQKYKTQATINGIVNGLFGWIGDIDWTPDDSAQAQLELADIISLMSSAITALQNDKNNAAVGGRSAFVDFTQRAPATTLGSDFDQVYTLSGDGDLGIGNGAEWLIGSQNAPRKCSFYFNALQTATDYQKIGVAFGSAPQPGTFNPARNEIHGRKNVAGTRFINAAIEKNKAWLSCVIDGAETVWKTTPTGTFSAKSNAIYWLECGTIGGLRIYRLLEGNRAILTHVEVGTASYLGPDYRGSGGAVYAYANGFTTNRPARMGAYAISDNQPATVVGSRAHMYRAATGGASVSAGAHVLPSNFFTVPGENTSDITYDLAAGSFTVSIDGTYDLEFRSRTSAFTTSLSSSSGPDPFPMYLAIYKNGVLWKYVGDVIRAYGYDISAASSSGQFYVVAPEAIAMACPIYLQEGDYVQIGYYAEGARSGFLTGDAGGLHTYFGITLANRSLA